jgi:hypothetical protein
MTQQHKHCISKDCALTQINEGVMSTIKETGKYNNHSRIITSSPHLGTKVTLFKVPRSPLHDSQYDPNIISNDKI